MKCRRNGSITSRLKYTNSSPDKGDEMDDEGWIRALHEHLDQVENACAG